MSHERTLWKKDGITYLLSGRSQFVYAKFWVGGNGSKKRVKRSTEITYSKGAKRRIEEAGEEARSKAREEVEYLEEQLADPSVSFWALHWARFQNSEGNNDNHIKTGNSRWLKMAEYFGAETPLSSIDSAKISDFVLYCREETAWGGDTIKRALGLLKWAFKEAEIRGYHMPKVVWPKVAPGDINLAQAGQYISTRDFATLLEFLYKPGGAEEPARSAAEWLTTAVSTGLRFEELKRLHWDDIRGDWIHLPAASTKTNTARDIPLSREIKDILESRRERVGDDGLVFPVYYQTLIENARKASGIRCTNRDLRHTAATHFAENGADLQTLMAIMGWKSPSMAQRYLHARKERLLQAAENSFLLPHQGAPLSVVSEPESSNPAKYLARPAGFEPATTGLEVRDEDLSDCFCLTSSTLLLHDFMPSWRP